MKRLFLTLIACASTAIIFAQTDSEYPRQADSLSRREQVHQQVVESFVQTREILRDWDTEHLIDSLDQQLLPRKVSGGIMGGSNISNFIVTRDKKTFSSFMRVGAEVGGFLDFTVSKHFLIEGQLLLTAEQNQFEDGSGSLHLWAFGIEMPVFFMGKYGSLDRGYLLFGGGPFTHFTIASNISNHYANNATDLIVNTDKEEVRFKDNYKLHDNHSGLGAIIGYEFPVGLQIMASYKVSLSDILTFYRTAAETEAADAAVYPQHIALTLGYHWR